MTDNESAGVVILTRAPIPGQAKSRLAATIGDAASAALARAFLIDTVSTCREAGLPFVLAFTPVTARPVLARTAPGVPLFPQAEGDLGVRIAMALREMLTRFSRAVLIGSDSPDLPPDHLHGAVRGLDINDLVLGPAEDGGFTLIAAREPLPEGLFDGVAWGTERVLGQVLANAAGIGLKVGLLSPWADVDDGESLAALANRTHGSTRCPATRAVIAELRLFKQEVTRG